MTRLLRRLNFVYKKTRSVPSKSNEEAQREFVKTYCEIREKSEANKPILFIDGRHPVHNNAVSCAWIQKGSEKRIKANSGRQRLNINGALDIKLITYKLFFTVY